MEGDAVLSLLRGVKFTAVTNRVWVVVFLVDVTAGWRHAMVLRSQPVARFGVESASRSGIRHSELS